MPPVDGFHGVLRDVLHDDAPRRPAVPRPSQPEWYTEHKRIAAHEAYWARNENLAAGYEYPEAKWEYPEATQ
jgi:hypothetical protein